MPPGTFEIPIIQKKSYKSANACNIKLSVYIHLTCSSDYKFAMNIQFTVFLILIVLHCAIPLISCSISVRMTSIIKFANNFTVFMMIKLFKMKI